MVYLMRKSTTGLMDIGYSLERNRLEVVSGIVNQDAAINNKKLANK